MSEVPQGYRSVPTPKEQVPMVPYDRLSKGREVMFHGTRRVRSKGEEYTIHEFTDKETRAAFGLWGCALLDVQLAGVPNGAAMFLQYAGKEQRRGGRTAHTFLIAVAGDVQLPFDATGVNDDDDSEALPF